MAKSLEYSILPSVSDKKQPHCSAAGMRADHRTDIIGMDVLYSEILMQHVHQLLYIGGTVCMADKHGLVSRDTGLFDLFYQGFDRVVQPSHFSRDRQLPVTRTAVAFNA